MIRELKNEIEYPRLIAKLSVLTAVFGIALAIFGELFLPLAAAFFAGLLIFENPQKRIFSYLIPPLTVTVGVLIKGLSALLSAQYVLLALAMALCYRFLRSKSECALYMSVTVSVFLVASLYFAAVSVISDWSVSAVTEYYRTLLEKLENAFVSFMSETLYNAAGHTTADEYDSLKALSVEQSEYYFGLIIDYAIAIIAVISFAISGFAVKLFARIILDNSKNGILKTYSHFLPTNLTAYAYVVLEILTLLSRGGGVFSIAVANASEILSFVFAYMGVQYVAMVGKVSGRLAFSYMLVSFAIIVAPTVAVPVLSYLGVWVVIGTNNSIKKING